VCKRASAGDLLISGCKGLVDDADAVAVASAEGDVGWQLRVVEATESALGDEEQSPSQGRGTEPS